ncbi:MAG: hypothetical protein Q9173_005656 [Seirophora scorigena]
MPRQACNGPISSTDHRTIIPQVLALLLGPSLEIGTLSDCYDCCMYFFVPQRVKSELDGIKVRWNVDASTYGRDPSHQHPTPYGAFRSPPVWAIMQVSAPHFGLSLSRL